jgi:hypothetical protein
MPNRFTQTFTAGPDHIDIMGHVNNAVWVQWMEAIATAHWMQDAAPDHVERYVWVVTRHEIDYRGNISQGQSVTAETFIPEGPTGAFRPPDRFPQRCGQGHRFGAQHMGDAGQGNAAFDAGVGGDCRSVCAIGWLGRLRCLRRAKGGGPLQSRYGVVLKFAGMRRSAKRLKACGAESLRKAEPIAQRGQ